MNYIAHTGRIIILLDSYYPSASTTLSLFNLINKSPHLIPTVASDLHDSTTYLWLLNIPPTQGKYLTHNMPKFFPRILITK